MGIQPRVEGESNLVIFSVFGDGAKSTSVNCNSGVDGGKGVSCRVAYEFKEGKEYLLKIEKEKGGDSGYNKWLGTITDRSTGERCGIKQHFLMSGFRLTRAHPILRNVTACLTQSSI